MHMNKCYQSVGTKLVIINVKKKKKIKYTNENSTVFTYKQRLLYVYKIRIRRDIDFTSVYFKKTYISMEPNDTCRDHRVVGERS